MESERIAIFDYILHICMMENNSHHHGYAWLLYEDAVTRSNNLKSEKVQRQITHRILSACPYGFELIWYRVVNVDNAVTIDNNDLEDDNWEYSLTFPKIYGPWPISRCRQIVLH